MTQHFIYNETIKSKGLYSDHENIFTIIQNWYYNKDLTYDIYRTLYHNIYRESIIESLSVN